MSFECALNRRVEIAHLSIRSWLRVNGGAGFRPHILNTSFDACAALKEKDKRSFSNPLARSLFSYIFKDSNANHSCPFEGDVYFRNIGITPGWAMNSFVPAGRYRLDFRFFEPASNETLFVVQIFTMVVNK